MNWGKGDIPFKTIFQSIRKKKFFFYKLLYKPLKQPDCKCDDSINQRSKLMKEPCEAKQENLLFLHSIELHSKAGVYRLMA